ncbi:MAG: hypothetical protein V2A56_00400, partial [bacterium]
PTRWKPSNPWKSIDMNEFTEKTREWLEERCREGVEILAEHRGDPVLVRKDNIWLATFHPERTDDRRLHKLIFQGKIQTV